MPISIVEVPNVISSSEVLNVVVAAPVKLIFSPEDAVYVAVFVLYSVPVRFTIVPVSVLPTKAVPDTPAALLVPILAIEIVTPSFIPFPTEPPKSSVPVLIANPVKGSSAPIAPEIVTLPEPERIQRS